MSKFRIMPHGRLQEWVAEEKGYFKDVGLDYEFISNQLISGPAASVTITSDEGTPAEVKQGAFESMEEGRSSNVSSPRATGQWLWPRPVSMAVCGGTPTR